jgi:predicted nucleotidyltransferase
MNQTVLADPIFSLLKNELEALYGPRLKRALLYGSRARGDHQPDSDYDVLVVLEGPLDVWQEQRTLSGLSSRLLWRTVAEGRAVDVSFKPMTEEQTQQRTGFMHNVRQEAIEL